MIKKINSEKTLAVANQTKRIETYARAKAALQTMEQNNLPINFESVAKMAGISKAWLYKQPDLCEFIKSKRDKNAVVKRNSDVRVLLKSKEKEIEQLRNKLKEKEATIKQLKMQIEKIYGELYNKCKDSW